MSDSEEIKFVDAGEHTLRIENNPQDVAIYGEGFEIARWTPQVGWQIRVDGELISLEKIIRQLNAVQATLSGLTFEEP